MDKELDATPYFSTITHFVSEPTLGHVVTVVLGLVVALLIVEQILCIFGMIHGIVIPAPKLATDISLVIKSILSGWSIENPVWRRVTVCMRVRLLAFVTCVH